MSSITIISNGLDGYPRDSYITFHENGRDGKEQHPYSDFNVILKLFGIERKHLRKYHETLPDSKGEIVSLSSGKIVSLSSGEVVSPSMPEDPNDGWLNTYADDYSIIAEHNVDPEKEAANRNAYIAKAKENPDFIRVWFSWTEDENGRKHVFTGVYKLDVKVSIVAERLVWRKVGDTIMLNNDGEGKITSKVYEHKLTF